MSKAIRGAETEEKSREKTECQLEEKADALLLPVEETDEYPAYTEFQLKRHGEGHLTRVDLTDEERPLPVSEQRQSLEEELLFLISVTQLRRVERCLLRGWLSGWTQEQMRRVFPTEAGRFSQQHLSRLLREAIVKCYSSGLLFKDYSRHTVYRKPARKPGVTLKMMTCRGCGHEFVFGLGAGRFYCSKMCFEASRHGER